MTATEELEPEAPVDWRAEERRGCLRKRRWNEAPARAEAARLRARDGQPCSPYPCPWHRGHWHVGHLPNLAALERLAAALIARRAEEGTTHPDPKRRPAP